MKILAALVLSVALTLGLVATSPAPRGAGADYLELPWSTFSEMQADVIGARPNQCPDQPVFQFVAEKDGNGYMVFYGISSGRVWIGLFVGAKEGSDPDKIGVGTLDQEAPDRIPPLRIVGPEAIDICGALRALPSA